MKERVEQGAASIVMHESDDVATALESLQAEQQVVVRIGEASILMKLKQPIPFGHKFAIRALPAGTEVRKYGEVIGRASKAIALGEHVHVHNLEGIRGRGDQASKGG
ncbi:UxaA family hydrolase [Paenibacillus camelliae]|uniref:UxaA family hydrolase n=1 Tax=Paenibacillus camelliae TaxID=512410 RepID=UPI00203F0962|nr:UxaA family hydrolase [Paenibacillus camelliae]MCM3634618.1 UxaA family hydrolase [Paenibacillus camelliae]